MREQKEILEFISSHQLSLINGKLLGDGGLTIDGNRKPRFRFQHRYIDRDWCNFCFESLKNFIPLNPPKYKVDLDNRVNKGFSESLYVQSKTSPIFTLLKSQWYSGKKKVLPIELLAITLTAESLAWWYQDDGHLVWKDATVKKIILSTDNFTSAENSSLILLLAKKFNLLFSLDGKNRLCLYDQPQIMYFLFLVQDYIHPAMARKLPPYSKIISLSIPLNKRSTVYLPKKLKNPSRDIRDVLNLLDPEKFVHNWFESLYTSHERNHTIKHSYQVILNRDELFRISKVQVRTGLRASDIVSILFTLKQKRGLSSGQTT